MHLTKRTVRELAHIARIGLYEDEIEQMTRDLNGIIDSLEPITHIDLEGVEPTYHPIAGQSNIMTDDKSKPGFSQEEALAQAPASLDGQYKVPPILVESRESR